MSSLSQMVPIGVASLMVLSGCHHGPVARTRTVNASSNQPAASTSLPSPTPETPSSPSEWTTNPQAFRYRDKPIHPACLAPLLWEGDPVDLAKCDDPAPVKSSAPNQFESSPVELVDGREFSQYEVLAVSQPAADGSVRFVLNTLMNGGGTGYFSGITVVALRGSHLSQVEAVGGGDRCNGGIREAKFDGTYVVFGTALTPVDLLNLVPDGEKLHVMPYVDLESSALSCVGIAHHRFDPRTAVTSFVRVTLHQPTGDQPGWTERYQHQSCFNRVLNDFFVSRSGELDGPKLSEFVAQFKLRCMTPTPE